MLNDSIWVDVGEDVFELSDVQNDLIATLAYDERYKRYELTKEYDLNFFSYIEAQNSNEAKWKATVELNNNYNNIISKNMKVRDHLPDLKILYESI